MKIGTSSPVLIKIEAWKVIIALLGHNLLIFLLEIVALALQPTYKEIEIKWGLGMIVRLGRDLM